jgi:uncharacterized RDD family membrane protein YckC
MSTPNPYAPPQADLAPSPAFDTSMLADRGSRLGASLLDFLLVLGAVLAMVGLIYITGSALHRGPPGPTPFAEIAVGVAVSFIPLFCLLLFQAYRLSTTGQTLGKKWVGIRVVRLDGRPVDFYSAVLLRAIVPALLGSVPFVGTLFSLADPLFIFREDRRCLHDLIATTKVVIA